MLTVSGTAHSHVELRLPMRPQIMPNRMAPRPAPIDDVDAIQEICVVLAGPSASGDSADFKIIIAEDIQPIAQPWPSVMMLAVGYQ